MSLTFTEYQTRAWSTAVYNNKGRNLEYISLGLGGECGEVQEFLKKSIHRNQDLDPNLLKGELGDLLWYLAGTASECKFLLYDALNLTYSGEVSVDNFNEFEERTIGIFKTELWKPGYLGIYLNNDVARLQIILESFRVGNTTPHLYILGCVTKIAWLCSIYGFTLEDVALSNLEKLTSRKDRGVLKGVGDIR